MALYQNGRDPKSRVLRCDHTEDAAGFSSAPKTCEPLLQNNMTLEIGQSVFCKIQLPFEFDTMAL